MELPEEIQSRVEEIRSDNTSGAVELAMRAVETLTVLAENAEVSSASQFTAYLVAAAQALVKAQPAMAPIFNLANKALLGIEGRRELEEMRQAVRLTCRHFVSQLESAGEMIGKLASDLIHDEMTIMTYSYSSTVLKALLLAKAVGKRFDVICTESRPMREGITLATKLAREGIAVKLIIDAAIFSFLPEVQMVLVGGDTLWPGGLVNKIGTSGLALAAKTLVIDVYALCGSEKFLPANYSPQSEELKDPGEILTENIANVTVLNYYFDLTPLEYLTGVVTEKGVMTPGELKWQLEGLRVHKAL